MLDIFFGIYPPSPRILLYTKCKLFPQVLVANFTTYSWDKSAERPTSVVASLETTVDSENSIALRNLSQDITINLPQRQQQPKKQQQFTVEFSRTSYHKINVTYTDILLEIDIKPTDNKTTLLVAIEHGSRPTKYEQFRYFLPVNGSRDPHKVRVASRPGVYYVGIRVALNGLRYNTVVVYSLQVTASACLYWLEEQSRWTSDGCKVRGVAR